MEGSFPLLHTSESHLSKTATKISLDSLHAKRQVLLERKEALDFHEPYRLLTRDEARPFLESLAQSEGYKALQDEIESVYSGHASGGLSLPPPPSLSEASSGSRPETELALNDLDEHPPASARQSVEDLFRLTNRPFERLSTDDFKKVSDIFTRVTSAVQDHLTKNDTRDTRDLVSSYVTRATKKLQQLTEMREEWETL